MKIVLVPEWLEKAVESRGADKTDLLDIEKLSSIVSLDDVAFYLELNEQLSRWIPNAICQTFSTGRRAVNYEYFEGTDMGGKVHDLRMGHAVTFRSTTRHTQELFGQLSDQFSPVEVSFVPVSLTYDTIALRPIRVGQTEKPHAALVDDLLYKLNDRLPFEALAQKPLFSHYLTSCMV